MPHKFGKEAGVCRVEANQYKTLYLKAFYTVAYNLYRGWYRNCWCQSKHPNSDKDIHEEKPIVGKARPRGASE